MDTEVNASHPDSSLAAALHLLLLSFGDAISLHYHSVFMRNSSQLSHKARAELPYCKQNKSSGTSLVSRAAGFGRTGLPPEKIEDELWRLTNLAGRSSRLFDIVGLLVLDEHPLQLL